MKLVWRWCRLPIGEAQNGPASGNPRVGIKDNSSASVAIKPEICDYDRQCIAVAATQQNANYWLTELVNNHIEPLPAQFCPHIFFKASKCSVFTAMPILAIRNHSACANPVLGRRGAWPAAPSF